MCRRGGLLPRCSPGLSEPDQTAHHGCAWLLTHAGFCWVQVHYMQTGGRSKLLAKQDARPSLRDLRCVVVSECCEHVLE